MAMIIAQFDCGCEYELSPSKTVVVEIGDKKNLILTLLKIASPCNQCNPKGMLGWFLVESLLQNGYKGKRANQLKMYDTPDLMIAAWKENAERKLILAEEQLVGSTLPDFFIRSLMKTKKAYEDGLNKIKDF